MAEPATDTPDTSAPPSPAGADIGSLLKPMTEGLSGLQREKTERTDAILSDTEQQLKTDEARVAKAYAATGVGPNELQPWDHAKQEEKYRTDPIEAFGSLGSVFGIVASAFTHAPMENALNASAAAIRATKEGNDEQRERAFRSYKENIDLVMKRHQMMHDSYADAVTLMKTNMAAGEARLSMEAARYGDRKVQALLDMGMSEDLFKLLDARNKASEGMLKASNAITEDSLRNDMYTKQAKAIDENLKENKDPNAKQMAAAHKLALYQTIYGTDKQSPQQQLMARKIYEDPDATADDLAEYAKKIGLIHQYKTSPEGMAIEAEQDRRKEAGEPAMTGQEIAALIGSMKARGSGGATLNKLDAEQVVRLRDKYMNDPEAPEHGDLEAAQSRARKEVARRGELLDDKTVHTMAEQFIAGDKSVFQNLGRGAQGADNIVKLRKAVSEVAEEKGLKGQDLALRMAEFNGLMSAQRTLGTRAANVDMFANEAKNMITVAKKLSDQVPRSEWVPVNKALQAWERNTGDPKIRAFGASINSLVNTYAKAIAGGGQATVSDKDHAREMLSTADSKAQFDAVVEVLEMELSAALAAPGQVKQQFRDLAKDQNLGHIPSAAPAGGVIKYDAQGNRLQ